MKTRGLYYAGTVLTLGIALSAPKASLGETHDRVRVAATPHFAFYSDFAANLNDALIATGEARNDDEPELFQSGDEGSCFAELRSSARAAWNQAVDYYAEIISPSDNSQRARRRVRDELAGVSVNPMDEEDQRFVEIAKGFLAAATPAYEVCRWPAQNAENRRWIDELTELLTLHEEPIARRLTELYDKPWHGLPIPVDVVQTVDWAGANTLNLDPGGGHILINSSDPSYRGHGALEMIFHEASHTLMGRNDPVWRALDKAAEALGQPTPEDLYHVVLFYTTGETVRRVLDDAGEPSYTPYLYEIFERGGSWNSYREAIETIWPAYLDGERTLSEAAADLIRALGDADDDRLE